MATTTEDKPSSTSTSRAEAFSDGVFAVAITLLVFNITVPIVHGGGLQQALLDQWPSYASYVVRFFTIGIIWVNYHATFSRIERVDRPFLFVNLLLLMSVSFIPFPTSLLSHYIQSGPDARVAAMVYSVTMTSMALAFSGVWVYDLRYDMGAPSQAGARGRANASKSPGGRGGDSRYPRRLSTAYL